MDQHRGEQPPPRRITINDRRKLQPQAAPSAQGDANLKAAPPGPPGDPAAPEASPQPAATAAPAEANPLQSQLETARAEAAAYLDDLQRLKAEFDNYRKRIVKEQTGLVERASAGLLYRLLPVLDNFELAVASAEESR